ncbi:branched-chain amino acid ABC transporter permease [uncultured Bradyrhizobium sp.]|jgi:branched-chain amino acid transport system permease protein|uniref:branched-chain amino acid ABC transporter permease n=1 Tax=uncultured Bradyrhizobium sp. TaxID=199684 RepID=UPI0026276445|nr:branched-chain amino acid ABC transporter permease [uncultured Bradyrhizobium sp.]
MDEASSRPVQTFRIKTVGRASHAALVVVTVALLALALLPVFAGRTLIQDLIFLYYMLALAQCWNLLAGYAGLISVGQQAFVGLGGYILFALTLTGGLNPVLAIPIAGLVSALFAFPTALVVFRLRGAYFAIGTWVVAEVYRLAFAQVKPLGGGTGTSLTPSITSSAYGIEWVKTLLDVRTPAARDIVSYWLALALVAGTLAAVYFMLRSRRGLALGAIRDHETAAASLGVDIYRIKLAVYVATAAMTGMIGALIYLQKARISPDAAFSVLDWTAYVIFIVVIGGIGTMEGPFIGAIILYLMQHYLADFGAWYLILLGALGILVMLLAPKGVWGLVSERFDLTLFPTRRRLVVDDEERPIASKRPKMRET